MKKLFTLLTLLLSFIVIAQTYSSKTVIAKVASYPKQPLPSNFDTYSVVNIPIKGIEVLDQKAIASILDFQSFEFVNNTDNPDFFVSFEPSDPKISKNVTRNADESLTYEVKTQMSLRILITDPTFEKIIYTKPYKLEDYVVNSTGPQQSSLVVKKEPKDINYEKSGTLSKETAAKYIVISEDGKKFRLTNKFLKELLSVQFERLLMKAAEDIQAKFDYRLADSNEMYFRVKKVEEEGQSEVMISELKAVYGSIETLEDYRGLSSKVSDIVAFHETLLTKYDPADKKQKNIVWTAHYNLAKLHRALSDYSKAKEHIRKAKELRVKKARTQYEFDAIVREADAHAKLYDENGNRKEIELAYTALKKEKEGSTFVKGGEEISKEDLEKHNIISKAGYVLDDKGEKIFEGKLTIEFGGTKTKKVYDIDTGVTTEEPSTDYGKKVEVLYLKKGKEKTKTLKPKDDVSFCVSETGACYEGFKVKQGALGAMTNMATLGFGSSAKFYLVKYKNSKVGIYQDLTHGATGYIVKLTKEDKGIELDESLSTLEFNKKMADVFQKCKELKSRLRDGEFTNSYEDIKKAADIYAECRK